MQEEVLCDELLAELCNTYLSYYQYDTALFFAERAYYENPIEENLQLIGECYIRMGKFKQAYLVLQNAHSLTNRYLLATCCIQLDKYTEAETALLPGQYVPPVPAPTTSSAATVGAGTTVPNEIVASVAGGTAGVFLLGKICRHEHRKDSAVAYFQKCLELDPFFWGAVVELSEMGVSVGTGAGVEVGAGGMKSMLGLFAKAGATATGTGTATTTQGGEVMSTNHTSVAVLGLSSLNDCTAVLNHQQQQQQPEATCSKPAVGAGGGEEVSIGAVNLANLNADRENYPNHPLSRINSGISCTGSIASTGFGSINPNPAFESMHRIMEQRKRVEGTAFPEFSPSPGAGAGAGYGQGQGQETPMSATTSCGVGSGIGAGPYTPRVALSLGLSSLSLRAPLPTATPTQYTPILNSGGGGGSYSGSESGSGYGYGTGQKGLYFNHLTHTGLHTHSHSLAHNLHSLNNSAEPSRSGSGSGSRAGSGAGIGYGTAGTGAARPHTHTHVRTSASNIADDFVLSRRALGSGSSSRSRSHSATSEGEREGCVDGGSSSGAGGGNNNNNNNHKNRVNSGRVNSQLFTGSIIAENEEEKNLNHLTTSTATSATATGGASGAHADDIASLVGRRQQLFSTPGLTPIAVTRGTGGVGGGLVGGVIGTGSMVGSVSNSNGNGSSYGNGNGNGSSNGYGNGNGNGNGISGVAPYLQSYDVSRIEPGSAYSGHSGGDTSTLFDITQLGASSTGGGLTNNGGRDRDRNRPPRVSFGPTARLSFSSSVGGGSLLNSPPLNASQPGSAIKGGSNSNSYINSGANSNANSTNNGTGFGLDDSDEVIAPPTKNRRSERGRTGSFPDPVSGVGSSYNGYGSSSSSGLGGGDCSPELRKLHYSHIQHPSMSPVSNRSSNSNSNSTDAIPRRTVHLSPMTKQKLHEAALAAQAAASQVITTKQSQVVGGVVYNGGVVTGSVTATQVPVPGSVPVPISMQQQQQLTKNYLVQQRTVALYSVFAAACGLLKTYKCSECLSLLHSLPRKHFNSGLVHSYLGLCYYEQNDYKLSVLSLKDMNRTESWRIQGLEILSTALWHLKRDKELCSLAHQITALDKFAPETWCVVGNCFSLQHEPEAAIRFFQRALQLDPSFSYAHTLCGHEYVANEDLDKAISSFRQAIRCDERHYNAWYGLGAVYYRQERLDLAEYHFRRAGNINSISSVLQCYMGMVLHAQNNMGSSSGNSNNGENDEDEAGGDNNDGYNLAREEEAFEILRDAAQLDPKNPQLHFQMVHVLLSLDSATSSDDVNGDDADSEQEQLCPIKTDITINPEQYKAEVAAYLDNHPYLQEAMYELHLLEELVPKEPPIYSLLGQIYQHKLRNTQLATKYYNIAIDLDPKESTSLKDILNNLEEPVTIHTLLVEEVEIDDGEEEGIEGMQYQQPYQ